MIDHLSDHAQRILLATAELKGVSEAELVESALKQLLDKVEGDTDVILEAKIPKTAKKMEINSAEFIKIYAAECAVFAFCSEDWYSKEFRDNALEEAVKRLSSVKTS